MNDIFTNIKADFDALVGSANDVINKTKGTNMEKMNFRPTPKQEALWKTYSQIVENLDNTLGDADGRHEDHQRIAIEQLALITSRKIDHVRDDIVLVCEWLKEMFTKGQ
jgi:hypothetical protein